MAFSTTIKRKYWEMKMRDASICNVFYEWKSDTPYWHKRLSKLLTPCDGVFLVGSEVHRVKVLSIREYPKSEVPKCYRGPIETERCFGLLCELIR